ncbi:MAG: hypothetical protein R3F06_00170 [Nitrosomonas sp.]
MPQFASFINDVRTVTPDIALQRKAIFRAYAMLKPTIRNGQSQ